MSQPCHQNRKKAPKASPSMPVIHPHAAGIDIGSDKMFVCVPTDSSEKSVAVFGAFTDDLLAIAAWLKECRVKTVAMESTGVYWIPLYEILEKQGFDVALVSPNYPKNPNKTDVEDCQWLQYLHSVGLLKSSFRPNEAVCAIRAILRHRSELISQTSSHILRMQKSLIQMNILLHNVISDITGTTGLAILDAILRGERDPKLLAKYRDPRVKASTETIEKSLVGNYRSEHLFTLRQSLESYRFCLRQIVDCDSQIEQMLNLIDSHDGDSQNLNNPSSPSKNARVGKNDLHLSNGDLRTEMTRIQGVNLTEIPGIGPNAACIVFTELGNDLSRFQSGSDFSSWLGLTPNPKISGGKVLGYSKRPARSKLAKLLRQCAMSLTKHDSYLGQFYRRVKSRFGPASAIKATAHKLAKIIYAMLTTKKAYSEAHFAGTQEQFNQKKINRLHKEAYALGYKIVAV